MFCYQVERILEYKNLPPENPVDPDLKELRREHPTLNFEEWPSQGTQVNIIILIRIRSDCDPAA